MRWATTQDYARLITCCCLLVALGVLSNTCEAKPQEKQTTSASSTTDAEAKKDSKQEEDSSNLPADSQANSYNNSLGPHLLKDFAYDQKAIWTSPANLRLVDADWLLPLGVATGAMLATDTDVSRHLSNSPSRLQTQQRILELRSRVDGGSRRRVICTGAFHA